jgi:ATP-dependent helicase HrpB
LCKQLAILNPFPYKQFGLPIANIIPQIQEQLHANQTLIIHAPPGAGKSTLLPPSLLNEPWLGNKKIIVLEPRRLAAKTIALRIADMLDEPVGQTVGYRIRFEKKVSSQTRIEIVTEGILARMLQHDNELADVGMVIFDEFHERSLHADLALALCIECQQVLRQDLKLVIMSATLDVEKLTELLKAPVCSSQGKQYPVDINYVGEAEPTLIPELLSKVVMDATRKHDGDILAFLPGEGEIKKAADLLKKALPSFSIHPLYGMLPPAEQMRAILPHPAQKRKVVLATSIAETSLTIEGITIVIDSGLSRISRFDPASGLSRLDTVMVSQDAADQRAGRAGRLSSGICYRMWSKATHQRLLPHRIPEIAEADLTALMLEMAMWGVQDVYQLQWITPPPPNAVKAAADLLEALNATQDGKITKHGKEIHRLPCHPRIAHMLLKAQELHIEHLACDLAALLEERDPLPKDSGIDINARIEKLRSERSIGAFATSRWKRIAQNAAQYRQLLAIDEQNEPFDYYDSGLLLAYAYPERIAGARRGNNAQFQLANGKIAVAGHRDELANEPWLAVANMDARDGLGKIFLAAPINPKDLAPMVKTKHTIRWDTISNSIQITEDLRIGSIVLKSSPAKHVDDEQVIDVLIQILKKSYKSLLNIDENFLQLQARIESVRIWNPEANIPNVSDEVIFENWEWIKPFIGKVRSADDFKKINIIDALWSNITYEKQHLINQAAPEKIKVPSGSLIPILYSPQGAIPILAVRLQEVFGLAETPKINNEKQAVVMHLLSPGYRPVQVTSDLKSFWNNTYHEIKKELQRRYPKHAWPDEPWSAKAVSKGGIRR